MKPSTPQPPPKPTPAERKAADTERILEMVRKAWGAPA